MILNTRKDEKPLIGISRIHCQCGDPKCGITAYEYGKDDSYDLSYDEKYILFFRGYVDHPVNNQFNRFTHTVQRVLNKWCGKIKNKSLEHFMFEHADGLTIKTLKVLFWTPMFLTKLIDAIFEKDHGLTFVTDSIFPVPFTFDEYEFWYGEEPISVIENLLKDRKIRAVLTYTKPNQSIFKKNFTVKKYVYENFQEECKKIYGCPEKQFGNEILEDQDYTANIDLSFDLLSNGSMNIFQNLDGAQPLISMNRIFAVLVPLFTFGGIRCSVTRMIYHDYGKNVDGEKYEDDINIEFLM